MGTGSGFGRKIGRDGGIEKKKGGKAGFENPYCGPYFMTITRFPATLNAEFFVK